jgi:microcystin-dependent protein
MATTNYSWNLPTVGGSEDTWGTQLNSNWSDLDTLLGGVTQSEFALLSGQTSLVPAGVILLWSGSIASIPSGWNLCDGTNGTPDLRNRFIVGAGDTYAVGATGGADSVTLTEAQMPAHTHSGSTDSAGDHNHTAAILDAWQNNTVDNNGGGTMYVGQGSTNTYTTSTAGAHTHTVTVGSTGGGGSHENRPPYYALAYIMKA